MRTKTPEEGQRRTSVGFSLMNARFFSMGTFNDNNLILFSFFWLNILTMLIFKKIDRIAGTPSPAAGTG